MKPRMLTVEIHNVTPAFAREVRDLHAALQDAGVARPVLLVTPSYVDTHGAHWDLRGDDHMVTWLQGMQQRGAEIALHGLTHSAPKATSTPGRGASLRAARTEVAEFAGLSKLDALVRLDAGLRILGDCGLRPTGFVAPAWQQSAGTVEALRELGFRYMIAQRQVVPLATHSRPITSVALTLDPPLPWLDLGRRAVLRGVELAFRLAPLLRVALHPRDVRGRRLVEHLVARIRALLSWRPLTTYESWLASPA